MNNFISIIIPLFNNERIIKNLLKNIKKIKSTNTDIFFVDDCSSDRTFKIVKDFVKKNAYCYLYKTRSNQGPGIARNLALKKK